MPAQDITIHAASTLEAEAIGTLVACLLGELYPNLEDMYQPARLIPVTEELLTRPTVFGFVARDAAGSIVGLVMLNQCEAIYAFGSFGEISELYVAPDHRSHGLGAVLLQAAVEFARSRNWSMLEVGAPDIPRWQKTVDFYAQNGFLHVGPRLYLPLS